MLTVLEVASAVSGPVPAPRPGPFVRVVVVVIGVVVGVLVGVVRVVAHHAVHVAGRPQIAERRAVFRRCLVTGARRLGVAGPGRRVASLEPVAGGGSGAAGGCSGRTGRPRPRPRRVVSAEDQERRARLRGGAVGSARGGGARVPSALRLVLRAQAQQAEHLPVVLPLDPLAPGAWSRRRLARGLLLAGGWRGAAHERAELQRPEQERGPGEAHLSLCRIVPTQGGRSSEKRKTGLKSRAGGRNLQPRRWAERGYLSPHQAVPSVGCRPFSSKGGCWDVALASLLFPSPSGRRRGAARRPRRARSVWSEGRRRDFKLSGTFAKLHKPFWPGRPSAICSRNAIGNVQGGQLLASAPPSPPLPVLPSSPQTRCTGSVKGKEQNGTHILRHTRLNLGRTCRNFKRLRQAKAARPWGDAKICTNKNAIRSPALERREVRRWGGCWGRESGRGGGGTIVTNVYP